jgi:hypothetical protein
MYAANASSTDRRECRVSMGVGSELSSPGFSSLTRPRISLVSSLLTLRAPLWRACPSSGIVLLYEILREGPLMGCYIP